MSPFSGTAGWPPRAGQFFISIDPIATAGADFQAKLAHMLSSFHDQGSARLPGDGRKTCRKLAKAEGVAANAALLEKVRALV